MKKIVPVVFFFLCFQTVNSQVLISLIFGDMLNSPKVEFGLEGGANFSTITNLEGAEYGSHFNLGFYFDFMLKNPSWMVNTGVIVKSTMGADKLPVYSLNNEDLDATFAGGFVDREIQYFNVPILMKYKFSNNIYVKGGTQLGLLFKATDQFKNYINDQKVEYTNNIRDQIHVIDAGLALGLGYRITKGEGINLGVQYYYGLVTVMKGDTDSDDYNRSFYITVGIPIGKGKAAREAAEKKAAAEKASGTIPPTEK